MSPKPISVEINQMPNKLSPENLARRNFVRKSAYVAPLILSLAAAPAFAKAGSNKDHRHIHPVEPVPKTPF